MRRNNDVIHSGHRRCGYLRAHGKRRLLVPVWLPGRAARAVRDGANLAPGRAVGRRTWEEFLAGQGREHDRTGR